MKSIVFKTDELDDFMAVGHKTKQEAFDDLVDEYPEIIKDINFLEVGFASKCLDCETWWFNDSTCGDCGEPRLSKRSQPAYYLSN